MRTCINLSAVASRRRWAGVVVGLVGTSAALTGSVLPAGAASTSGTQTMTATTAAGSLSVTAPSGINLGGAITPGTTVSNSALGSLSWTDTLNNSTASSMTVAATSLFNATGPKIDPFTNFSVGVGQTVNTSTGNSGTTPTAAAAGPTALTGTDTTPGTTFSNPLTLATASTTTEGTWTQTGNQITVIVPASLTNSGAMSSTLQYTITG